jgi:hypothetical protein
MCLHLVKKRARPDAGLASKLLQCNVALRFQPWLRRVGVPIFSRQ